MTVGSSGVTAAGSANLHVALSGASEAVIPVSFTATPTTLTIDGLATLPNFRFGNEPAVIAAQNVGLTVHAVANIATGTVTGEVSFSVARATVLPTSGAGQALGGPVTVTNLRGTLSANGKLTASAAGVDVLFQDFVRVSAANAALSVDLANPSAAVLTAASAVATSPKFPGASAQVGSITIGASGFTIGNISLNAPTIPLPGNSRLDAFSMTVTNLQFSRQNGFSVSSMSATAGRLVLFGGQATVNQIAFSFNGTTGVVTGSVASASGAIGPVSFSAGVGQISYALGAQLPSVSLATATLTMPVGTGSANLTVTGFQLTPDGRLQFNALAGLTLPQLSGQGIAVTGTFSGDVRSVGGTTFVRLTGNATAYGTPVRLSGEFISNSSGLFGVMDVQSTTGGSMPVLGTTIGMRLSGAAQIAVNSTGASKSFTLDGQTRTVAANSVWLHVVGDVTVGNFDLSGKFDLLREGDHWRVTPTATLTLGGFGSFTVGGSFSILSNGVVGSMALTQGTGAGAVLAMSGSYRLELNTTATTQNNIAPGVRVIVGGARVDLPSGMRLSATLTIGYENGYYFASLSNANLSLWNGAATASVTGEIRSTGYYSFSGHTALVLDSARLGVPGLVLNTTLDVSVTNNPTTGLSFSASGSGGISVFGTPVIGSTVSIDQTGHGTVTGKLLGVDVTITFQM